MAEWSDIFSLKATADGLPERDVRFDRPPLPPMRERRLHARAYRYWRQLRGTRRLPEIAAIDPAALGSYAANSVLFEVPNGVAAGIRFIGAALAGEAGAAIEPAETIVPTAGTLLGELAGRLPLIATTGAPLDFEAEFQSLAGQPTLYRGVLLPFADKDGRIAYIYGVITWKTIEAADAIGPDVLAAIGSAFAMEPTGPGTNPWGLAPKSAGGVPLPPQSFAQRLAAAQTWAMLAETDHAHRDASLHAALSASYDFLLAQEEVLGTGPDQAEIAAVIGLVFGTALPDTARRRHRAVLAHALMLRIGCGTLAGFLDRHADGVTGFLAAQPATPGGWPERPFINLSAIDEAALAGGADVVRDEGRAATG